MKSASFQKIKGKRSKASTRVIISLYFLKFIASRENNSLVLGQVKVLRSNHHRQESILVEGQKWEQFSTQVKRKRTLHHRTLQNCFAFQVPMTHFCSICPRNCLEPGDD